MKHTIIMFGIMLWSVLSFAQKLETIATKQTSDFRALSVVNDKIVWVSGSNGTVGRSTDAGKTWTWLAVPGFETRDFRGIEAFDENNAIVITAGMPAQILKTTNGGKNWRTIYANNNAGMYFTAIEFWNTESGIILGDPVNGSFFILRSFDGGETWREIPQDYAPKALKNEVTFAGSGTCLRKMGRAEACFVTGGNTARLFSKGNPVNIPVMQGSESAGAYSIAIQNDQKLKGSKYYVVVGGDYTKPNDNTKNCAITKDGGKTWHIPAKAPSGYRSCVEFVTKNDLVTCGPSGIDISTDGGYNWKNISTNGYNVCRKSKKGDKVILAGANGSIAILDWK